MSVSLLSSFNGEDHSPLEILLFLEGVFQFELFTIELSAIFDVLLCANLEKLPLIGTEFKFLSGKSFALSNSFLL